MWFLRLKLILFPRQHQKKKISGHKSGLTPLSTLLYFYRFLLLVFCEVFCFFDLLFVWYTVCLINFALYLYCIICISQDLLFFGAHTITSTYL